MSVIKYDVQAFQRMEYGGIPTYFIELAQSINVDTFSNYEVYQDGIFTSNPELKRNLIFPIYFKSRYVGALARSINPRFSRVKKYDLIHSTYYHESFLNKIPKERHIITIHDMIPEDYPTHFDGVNPHRAKVEYIKKSAAIICVSNATKVRLLAHHPWIPEDSIFVVHHASKFSHEFSSFKETQILRQMNSEIFKILYVGSRRGYKNFSVLLKAVQAVKNSGIRVEVFCAGGDDFSQVELREIKELRLQHVISHSKVSESTLKELYLKSSCHITTSLSEGFGLPLLEAMSLACPTVISTAGALQEVSRDSSLIFDPGDYESLASQLISLALNPDLLRRLSLAGFHRSKDFNWATTAAQTVGVYKHVLDGLK